MRTYCTSKGYLLGGEEKTRAAARDTEYENGRRGVSIR